MPSSVVVLIVNMCLHGPRSIFLQSIGKVLWSREAVNGNSVWFYYDPYMSIHIHSPSENAVFSVLVFKGWISSCFGFYVMQRFTLLHADFLLRALGAIEYLFSGLLLKVKLHLGMFLYSDQAVIQPFATDCRSWWPRVIWIYAETYTRPPRQSEEVGVGGVHFRGPHAWRTKLFALHKSKWTHTVWGLLVRSEYVHL